MIAASSAVDNTTRSQLRSRFPITYLTGDLRPSWSSASRAENPRTNQSFQKDQLPMTDEEKAARLADTIANVRLADLSCALSQARKVEVGAVLAFGIARAHLEQMTAGGAELVAAGQGARVYERQREAHEIVESAKQTLADSRQNVTMLETMVAEAEKVATIGKKGI
jgi:hypothetical protein